MGLTAQQLGIFPKADLTEWIALTIREGGGEGGGGYEEKNLCRDDRHGHYG